MIAGLINFNFVLRMTSGSSLDRDKGTQPFTRENATAFYRPDY